jgi:hypothetical protein
MGAKETKLYEHGRLTITTECVNYTPGESLNGQVHLHLEQSYPSKRLMIEFIGVEKVKFEVSSGDDSSTEKKKHKILNMSFVGGSF